MYKLWRKPSNTINEMQLKKGSDKKEKRRREGKNNIRSNNKNANSTNNNTTTTPVNKEHLNIYSCMIHAHLMNVIEPGSYEAELNATLKENNLPPIKIPKNPNSSKPLSVR